MNAVELPGSPFKGLAPYEDSELDALLFFGRERETEVIAANLMASRLTVLYGPTGVGKSSILRAGVSYRLRREQGVEVVVFDTWAPEDPVADIVAALGGDESALPDALADAATRAGGDVYLVLDQFEEYFVYHGGDTALPDALAEALGRAGLRANLLIGIREEALAQLDSFKRSIPTLLANRLRLERLDRRAGEAAIVGPVDAFNRLVDEEHRVEVEPELVEAVLDEVAIGRVELGRSSRRSVERHAEADGIEAPYLQLVMERLWDVEGEHATRRLRRETLRELGGAAQIVEEHLERAMAELSAEQKDAAAEMYNHLVTPSGAKIGHDIADLARYADIDESSAAAVLDRLARERIVRATSENGAGATRYEIFHDVLADAVLAWRTRYEGDRALAESERGRRRAHRVAAGALAALALVAALAIFALLERGTAQTQAHRAEARELAATAAGDLALDPQRSLMLARRAARLEPTDQVEDLLRDALIASRVRDVIAAPRAALAVARSRGPRAALVGDATGRVRALGPAGGWSVVARRRAPITSVALDGSWFAFGAADGSIVVLPRDGRPRVQLRQPARVTAIAYSPGKGQLATGGADGTVRLWKLPTTKPRRLQVRGSVTSLAFSGDGRLLVVVSADSAARLIDVRSGRIRRTLRHDGFVYAAAFSPDGRRVVTGGYLHTAKIWSTKTGRRLRVLDDAENPVTAVEFSRDGTRIVTGSRDNLGRVYDEKTGIREFVLLGHSHGITSASFSPDANYIITGSSDGTARLWKSDIGRAGYILSGHHSSVAAAFFTSTGNRVVTAGSDGTVRVWDPGLRSDLRVLVRQRAGFWSAAIDKDGSRIVTGDKRGVVRVWTADARRVLRTSKIVGPIRAVAFGPAGPVAIGPPRRSLAFSTDGSLEAVGRDDGTVVLSRPGTSRVLARIQTGSAPVLSVAFSGDDQLVATATEEGLVRLWHVRTGTFVRALIGHVGPVMSVSFSPDSKLLVTAGRDQTVRLWSLENRRPVAVLRPHGGTVFGASFSPDGRWIVTAGPTTVGITSVRTRRTLLLLRGHGPVVRTAAFAPDGRTIISAGDDGTLRSYRCDLCATLPTLVRLADRQLKLAPP